MNFQALKWMVDSLIQTYSCPDCESKIWEDSVEVMWTAGQNINIDIQCPKCQKHSMIRAQILALEIPIQDIKVKAEEINSQITKSMQNKLDEIGKFKWHIEDMKSNSEDKTHLIKDDQIIELNKNLKSNNISMSELFGNK